MKNIGLTVNLNKDNDLSITKKIISTINSHGLNVYFFEKSMIDMINENAFLVDRKAFYKIVEAVFCLGGDGSLLNVAGKMMKYGIPIMGINLGHLGFLTEIDINELEAKIYDIANDNYTVEQRQMLEVTLFLGEKKSKHHCLNDFIISRGASPRLINVNAFIDEHFVDSFTGDGVIVSTPTGSTAYSLSCGGPIADPSMEIMLITPICPHNIYSRTFLVDPKKTVKIEVKSKNEFHGLVTLDGQKSYQIKSTVTAYIKTSKYSLKLLKVSNKNFYDVLRKKLYNRGEG